MALSPVNLDDLLEKTSRTFALSIPLLEPPLREKVAMAYLFFRIADTFEDADLWQTDRRVRALQLFKRALRGEPATDELIEICRAAPPTDNAHYMELLFATPELLDEYRRFPEGSRRIINHHLIKTIDGMAEFLETYSRENRIAVESVAELKRYCYIVAGIVGEMLSDLFIENDPRLEPHREILGRQAVAFGEGLQLTNIIKDFSDDAKEKRRYLPAGVPVEQIIAIAEADLAEALEYVNRHKQNDSPKGLLGFLLLPVMLAFATLQEIRRRGPGAKVSRELVGHIVAKAGELIERPGPVALDELKSPLERPGP